MAATKNATYKIYNGTDWDTVFLKTSANQVGETSTLCFLRPSTHKVNGKSFYNGTAHQEITLYATDITLSKNNSKTISSNLSALWGEVQGINESLRDLKVNESNVTMSNTNHQLITGAGTLAEFAYKVDNYLYNNFSTKLGVASGIATLDSTGKVPSSQLPGFVDDVVEVEINNLGGNIILYPGTTQTVSLEKGKIYVAVNEPYTNKTYRWSGSNLVEISASLVIGTVAGTAYDGASGAANATDIANIKSGATTVPKATNATYAESAGSATTAGEADHLSTPVTITIGSTEKSFDGSSNVSWTLADIDSNLRRVYEGSTTPTGMTTGDIWISY